jgi:hypothetical protein
VEIRKQRLILENSMAHHTLATSNLKIKMRSILHPKTELNMKYFVICYLFNIMNLKRRFITLISLILCSCSTSKLVTEEPIQSEQIFITEMSNSEPGKCYARRKNVNDAQWHEVLCESEITITLINEIQRNLHMLGYQIDQSEIKEGKMGNTTKIGIKNFQLKNGLEICSIDWATINLLRSNVIQNQFNLK